MLSRMGDGNIDMSSLPTEIEGSGDILNVLGCEEMRPSNRLLLTSRLDEWSVRHPLKLTCGRVSF